MNNERGENGRFAPGNPGGPGRPRRAVEHDYMAVVGDSVSLEDWRAVVSKALANAKRGDSRARDWLTKYLLGNDPPQLLDLAARERRGETVDEVVDGLAGKQRREAEWAAVTDQLMGDLTKR
jgi:hypothetical protein